MVRASVHGAVESGRESSKICSSAGSMAGFLGTLAPAGNGVGASSWLTSD
jgi:hypothetical protein